MMSTKFAVGDLVQVRDEAIVVTDEEAGARAKAKFTVIESYDHKDGSYGVTFFNENAEPISSTVGFPMFFYFPYELEK